MDHAIDSLRSPLTRWLNMHGLRDAETLASIFSEAELASGRAVDIILEDLTLDLFDDDLKELIDRELRATLRIARRLADRSNARLARRPTWELAAKRAAKRLRDESDERQRRWEALVAARRGVTQPPPPARPRYATARRRAAAHAGDEKGREAAEINEREKWLAELTDLLKEWDAPCLHEAAQSSNPARATRLMIGGRRASTLRARVRELRRLRAWLRALHGVSKPSTAAQVSDYLCERADEAGTKSALSSAWAALRFQEDLLGHSGASRLTEHPLVQNGRQELLSAAQSRRDGAGRMQAPQPPAALLVKLEEVAIDQGGDAYERMISWWCLLSSWGCLRFDDHRGLPPSHVVEYPDRYQLTFTRTKTTGGDKKTLLRPGVIAKGAYIKYEYWFSVGSLLWQSCAPFERDYFLCPPAHTGGCAHQELGYPEYSARMRSIIASLRDDADEELGIDAAMYWTPHSFRAFLPSALNAMGAGEGWLTWLTGWKVSGAQLYARTGLGKTLLMQTLVAKIAREHVGGQDPIGDGPNLDGLRAHLKRRGANQETEDRVIAALTIYPNGPIDHIAWPKGPAAETAPSITQAVGENVGNAAGDEEATSQEAPTSGYIISISIKKQIRCLHLLGACYRQPGIHYAHYEHQGDELPGPAASDTYCRGCWGGGARPSGSQPRAKYPPSSVDSESESSSSSTAS